MHQALSELENLLSNRPKNASPTSYLHLRNSQFNIKPAFDPNYPSLPSLVIDNHFDADVDLPSSAVQLPYHFPTLLQATPIDVEAKIVDHITDLNWKSTSIKVLGNKDSQLNRMEESLAHMMEDDRVDINSFSQNSLTNLTNYDYMGQPIGIGTIPIDPNAKRHSEQESLNHLPHPIRSQGRRKVKGREGQLKSREQILQQFEILNGMFTLMDEKEGKKEQVAYKEIVDLVSLNEGSDYNDLWSDIMEELALDKEGGKRPNRAKISQAMGDEQFKKTINRIVEEATQYEEENYVEEDDQASQESQPSEEAEKQQKEEKVEEGLPKREDQEGKVGFESVRIEKRVQSKGKRYQWAIEDTSDLSTFYDTLPKQRFALDYPFELDQFQKRSVLHLQKKQSVFVAAHTSAGKTVVAEYGIALAIKHKRKVIYTSPIKALSNQKYRQLSRRFDSVGIVTGDVSMNPQASCVIMTTEILRNQLYRGAQMIRDIEWVIFDQVHYINNPERGVVWEETIIMLPQHIGLIMLSATVPNYMDFANWVGRTKRRVIFVMKTLHRPVPLEHSLYIFGKKHVIKQPNGPFLQQDYRSLRSHINDLARGEDLKRAEMRQKKQKKINEKGFYNDNRRQQRIKLMTKNAIDKFIKKITKGDLENAQGKEDFRVLEELIGLCKSQNLLPCVVFCFSKKRINLLAQKLCWYDLTNRHEKSKIQRMISHALGNLKPEDQELPQIDFLVQICLNGYAVHHGDLLPIAKEIVELLFSEGLIKVLFATETFAMGINMPTKTVIFHTIRKVAGSEGSHRFLNSSEYVQMSGRAGRRGLDQKGNVIIVVQQPNQLPQSAQMVKMMDHPGQQLHSKFKVTYQIILNLYNNKDFDVQEMMRQSFFEDPKFKEFTSNIKKIKELQQQYDELSDFQCPYNKLGTRIIVEEYVELANLLREDNFKRFRMYDFRKVQLPRYGLLLGHNNQTQLCLILRLEKGEVNRNVQVLLIYRIYKDLEINKEEKEREQKKLGIKKRVVLKFDEHLPHLKEFRGEVEGTNNDYHFSTHWVRPDQIITIYKERLGYKKQLDDSKKTYAEIACELLNPPKQLTPVNENVEEEGVYRMFTNIECHNCEFKDKHLHQQQKRKTTKGQVSNTANRINKNQLSLMGSFEGMLKLLQNNKFIHEQALTLKGRIARQVDIYVAQVMVEAVLDPLNPPEIAALLSAFVCDYKPRTRNKDMDNPYSPFNQDDTYTEALDNAIAQTNRIVTGLVVSQLLNGSYINPGSEQELVFGVMNFHLADTVYKWACGFDFAEARQDSGAPEGIVVRAVMRLNMLLGNVKNVCRLMGSGELQQKVDKSIELIKRDIVFCPSLYLAA